MSQKLVVDGFKWIKELSKIDECFIKNYNGNSDKGYILEVEVEYPKNLFNLDRDLPVLSKRKKIKKCNKLSCSIQERKVCCSRKRKEALNHGLILKKMHRLI